VSQVAAQVTRNVAISHKLICTSGNPERRKLAPKDPRARTVPRIRDFLCNWRMGKRCNTELYFTATRAGCGIAVGHASWRVMGIGRVFWIETRLRICVYRYSIRFARGKCMISKWA